MKQNLFLKGVAILVVLAIGIATGEGKNLPAKFDDKLEDVSNQGSGISDSFLNPHDPDDLKLVHHYTTEEINKHRWISIDRDGIETIATDREVIAILNKMRQNNSTKLINEPHFPPNHPLEEMTKKRNIIGYDGRYHRSSTCYPYCAMGAIESRGCTAFLVGPYHAITAGHCVYDYKTKKWKPRRGIYLRSNCYSRGIYMNSVRTWTDYHTDCNNTNSDIAWILLDNTNYNSSCWMGYGFRNPMPIVSAEVCGYPGDKPRRLYNCLYCSRCGGVRQGLFGGLEYTCDTGGGMSGGPVFTGEYLNSEYEYVIGVHTYGGRGISNNGAAQFTRFHYQWTRNWKCNFGGYSCN